MRRKLVAQYGIWLGAPAFLGAIIAGAGFAAYQYYTPVVDSDARQNVSALEERIANLETRTAVLSGLLEKANSELSRAKEQSAEANERIETALSQKSEEELLTTAVSDVSSAVVSIERMQDGKRVGSAAGFFVSSNGHIVTNRHVVDVPNVEFEVILADGRRFDAERIYSDPSVDFAILKISGSGYHAAALGDSDALSIGQTVFAIGNPFGRFSNSVSVGVISGLGRNIEAESDSGTEELSDVIQTDAAINPGNSGGPLATLSGKVIGINVATTRGGDNVSFSVPINAIKQAVKLLTY